MAISKSNGRQWPLTAIAPFTLDDVKAGTSVEIMDLPAGALVIGGSVVVVNAFDSVTTSVLVVGDKTTANRFGSAINIKTLGGVSLQPAGAAFATKDAVTIKFSETGGAATVGDGYVIISYILENRANEVNPA